jgi:hypothetical protein
MRKWFYILCLMMIGALPAKAGGPPWSAWLYDAENGEVVLVGADGSVMSTLDLPMGQGFNLPPQNVAVSRSGTLIAFLATNGDTQDRQFRVYDTAGQSIKVAYNLPKAVAESTSIHADDGTFSDTEREAAIGYALDGGKWEVAAFDIASGQLLKTLTSDTVKDVQAEGTLVPVVVRFNQQAVTFLLVAAFTETQPRYSSFTWSLNDDSVQPAPAYTTLEFDVFQPTGEIVRAAVDPALPNQAAAFPYFQANVLDVYLPDTSEAFTFYNAPERTLYRPRFVEQGKRILAAAADQEGNTVYRLIERDGKVASAFEAPGLNGLRGLTDGFLYSAETDGTSRLVYVNTTGDHLNAQVVWSSGGGQPFRLVWAGDRRIAPVGPFTAWMHLEEDATPEATSTPEVTATPVGEG